ncbi:MAG: Uma2 family endonuclease [Isosphaeraceae bacterium]|nr:Uma2 family endonuclease [Isosphaeraceae bacterium]
MAHRTKTEPLVPLNKPIPPGRLTYEEYLDWLDSDTHAEWVDGEVVLMNPSNLKHADMSRFLIALLSFFVDAHQLGQLCHESFPMKTGLDLPGRSPNIVFVAKENLHRLRQAPDFLDGPADLVVEIISPESRTRDRKEEKYAEYERGGVREYWLIDPERRRADFDRLGDEGRFTPLPIDEAGVVRSSVLDGLWREVDWLWREPKPLLRDVLRAWGLI